MIQQTVNEANKAIALEREAGQLTKKVLAVGMEINQRYIEYLDDILDSDLSFQNGVDVEVNETIIHFDSMDEFSVWAAENQS